MTLALQLGGPFDEALIFAVHLHAKQVRKASAVPYVAHLLAVCALVLEDSGTETEAIAALLHDAVEDQGGQATLGEIRRRFGDAVAGIVAGCSDTDLQPKPPWRPRKERYLDHLDEASPEELRVSLADKIHNARAILFDLRRDSGMWARFSAGKAEQLWYYRELADAFGRLKPGPMADELERVVAEIELLARVGRNP